MAKKSYTVTYQRDTDGWWVASIRKINGCHTQGKNIAQARTRIRECLGLFIGDKCETAILVDDIRVPEKTKRLLKLVESMGKSREKAEKEHRDALRRVAADLTEEGYSLQDAGELLSVSRQRVHQLLNT